MQLEIAQINSFHLQEYEYMLGDDLLVSPVLLPGVTTWTVYLPGSGNSTWLHLWSGQAAGTGGQMTEVAASQAPSRTHRPTQCRQWGSTSWWSVFRAAPGDQRAPGAGAGSVPRR